jgi:hypothetical protein
MASQVTLQLRFSAATPAAVRPSPGERGGAAVICTGRAVQAQRKLPSIFLAVSVRLDFTAWSHWSLEAGEKSVKSSVGSE